jgi:hypothetical protein
MSYWQTAKEELNKAYQARMNQNEGMARVCARRSAGWAIRAYLSAQHIPSPTPNAFALIKDEALRQVLPEPIHTTLDHLSLRVDLEHNLPDDVDLLQETTELVDILYNLSSKEGLHGE